MPHSLRVRLKNLQRKGELTEKDIDRIFKALEQEPCDDAISRAYIEPIIEELENICANGDEHILDLLADIKNAPPVNPQQKTGHWIQTNEFFINQDGQFIYKFICSGCKSISYFRKNNKKAIGANVCPNCGARMIETQEGSDKE